MTTPPYRQPRKAQRRRQLRDLRITRRDRPRRLYGTGQHVVYAGGRCQGCGWHWLDITLYARWPEFCPAVERPVGNAKSGGAS